MKLNKILSIVITCSFIMLSFSEIMPIVKSSLNENLEDYIASPLKKYVFPEKLEFTLRKEITISINSGPGQLDYTYKIPCPKNIQWNDYEVQDIKEIKVYPEPSTGFPNLKNTSQEMMIWEGSQENECIVKIRIEYTIHTWTVIQNINSENSGIVEDIPNEMKDQYNHDEWKIDNDYDGVLDIEEDIDNDGEWDYYIEPSNSQIKALALQLANDEKNVYKIIKNFYDYLTKEENLNYVSSSQGLPKACTTTLKVKQGDCDDYSILFISLCRAMNIPAWLELGYLYDVNMDQWIGYCWANAHIPLKNGESVNVTIDIINKQFLFRDCNRFTDWVDTGGDGIYPGETKVRNNLDYYYHAFSYEVTGSIRPDIEVELETSAMNSIGEIILDVDDGKEPEKDEKKGFLPGFELSIILVGILLVIVFKRKRGNK